MILPTVLLYFCTQIRYILPTLRSASHAVHRPIELNQFTMKTNKSFTKRIKVTKNGKLVARRPGQNHFNARQTGQQRLARKRSKTMNMSERLVRRFLPGNAGRAKKVAAAAKQSND